MSRATLDGAVVETPSGETGERTGVLTPLRILVAIVLVGAALRLGWVAILDPFERLRDIPDGDQKNYLYYGREIAEGRGYVDPATGQPTAYYPIGYPATLAVLFWFLDLTPLSTNDLLAAQLLNTVLGTAVIVMGYVLARALFGVRAGLVAAAIIAVFPNLVFQAGTAQLETPFTFWYLLSLCVLVTHDWSSGLPTMRRLAVFGTCLGVSVVIRPFSVWFVVGVFVAALVARAGWRRGLLAAAVPLAIVIALSVPWTIRNAVRMDAFVPTSTNTGDTLCIDRVEGAKGGFQWAYHEGCADRDLAEVPRNAGSTRKAIRFVLDDPVREVVQMGKRGRLMLASDHEGVEFVNYYGRGEVMRPSRVEALSDVADRVFWVVLALAPVGIAVAVISRRARPELVLVLVALASLVAVPLLLWGAPRFHIPFSPLLAVFAGGALVAGFDAVRSALTSHRAPAAAPGDDHTPADSPVG